MHVLHIRLTHCFLTRTRLGHHLCGPPRVLSCTGVGRNAERSAHQLGSQPPWATTASKAHIPAPCSHTWCWPQQLCDVGKAFGQIAPPVKHPAAQKGFRYADLKERLKLLPAAVRPELFGSGAKYSSTPPLGPLSIAQSWPRKKAVHCYCYSAPGCPVPASRAARQAAAALAAAACQLASQVLPAQCIVTYGPKQSHFSTWRHSVS